MSGNFFTGHLSRRNRRLFQVALGLGLFGTVGTVSSPARATGVNTLIEWFEGSLDPGKKLDLPDFDAPDFELSDKDILFLDPKDLGPIFDSLKADRFPGHWGDSTEEWFRHLEDTVFARDEVPPACADFQARNGCWGTQRTHRIYEKGVRKGRRFVLRKWSEHQGCGDLEAFVEVLNHKLIARRPHDRHAKKLCRYGGFSDGLMDALEGIRERCAVSCADDGRLLGKVSAGLYCSFSQISDGLDTASDFVRGPVNLCGQTFQESCDETFVQVARDFEDDSGSCQEYTEGHYAEIFDRYRNDLCIYKVDQDPGQGHAETGSTGADGESGAGTETGEGVSTGHEHESAGTDETSTDETGTGTEQGPITGTTGHDETSSEEESASTTTAVVTSEDETGVGGDTGSSSEGEASTEDETAVGAGEGSSESEEGTTEAGTGAGSSESEEGTTEDGTGAGQEIGSSSGGDETTESETSVGQEVGSSTGENESTEHETSVGQEVGSSTGENESTEDETSVGQELGSGTGGEEETTQGGTGPDTTVATGEQSTEGETTSDGEGETSQGDGVDTGSQNTTGQGVLASESGPDSTQDGGANAQEATPAPLGGPLSLTLLCLGLGALRRNDP